MLVWLKLLTNKIPDSASKPMVIGLMLWLTTAALMALSFLLVQLKWTGLYQIVFALMSALILGFIGCVAWFLFEFTTGRKTPWRQRENP